MDTVKSIADLDIKDLIHKSESLEYSALVKQVRKILGFQPNEILTDVADDIITIMAKPNLDDLSRRQQIAQCLFAEDFEESDYYELAKLCRKIPSSDQTTITTVNTDRTREEDLHLAVPLEEDVDDNHDDYLSEINEDQEDDDEFELDVIFEKNEQNLLAKDDKQIDFDELMKIHSNFALKTNLGEPVLRDGYKEYHIEPVKKSSTRLDLVKITELPDHERMAFKDFKELNPIQSRIYKTATTTDKSLLICAPTGAGKTNIALLTMLREISKSRLKDGSFDPSIFKIIYIAPIKALVQEIVANLSSRLGCNPYNLIVEELTGDHQLDQREISQAHIIVCTPEKWDIVTRKSLDRLYLKSVRLVIFDEIHLLHNDRGATLEALIARIKRHKQIEGESIRIIGLSATLPNYRDVARFIEPNIPPEDTTFYFDTSYRPIPLSQQFIALTETKRVFRKINEIVYEKVMERLPGQSQILIFVHSRPDTIKTAQFIKTNAFNDNKVDLLLTSQSAQAEISNEIRDLRPDIQELIKFGIGVHHAGLSSKERNIIESLFKGKYIKVLVSTATLAWGVNLPARVVIIKGTQVYRDGRWTDLDSLDVCQMLGRAGRPGFDTQGEGIVITQESRVHFYISLMTEQLPVESRLIGRLPEFINAECVISNIESLDDAIRWISETYLSSRMMSLLENTDDEIYLKLYGLNKETANNDPKLTLHKKNLAYSAANILDHRGLILFDRQSGLITTTELGRIASHYNCTSKTIKHFHDSVHENTSDTELMRIFSLAQEFKDIFVRRGEELDLQTLIDQLPFPIDTKRATPGANKVNALLQVYILKLNIEGSELVSDIHFIKDNAARLARALHEIVLLKNYAHVAELTFDLCRKIDKRMTVCHTPIRQFSEDLNLETVNKLERKNYLTNELKLLKPEKLVELLRCDKTEGERLYKLLKYIPKYKIEAIVKPISKTNMKVDLNIIPEFVWSDKYHGYLQRLWLLVEDVNQEVILHYETAHIKSFNLNEDLKLSFHLPFLTPPQPFYYIRVMPDGWFGCDHQLPIHIAKLTLPSDNMITLHPDDVEPLPFSALDSEFAQSYDERFKGIGLNQIQTHIFKHLYHSNQDIILLAPAGSGKTTCAEWAILKNLKMNENKSMIGYIAPNHRAAQCIFDYWTEILPDDVKIYLLTGNHRQDNPIVFQKEFNLIVGDPSSWNSLILVRSKKYAKLMDQFKLFILDDIHTLHDDETSYLEWVCTKIRILTKLSEHPARIIALGSPVSSAESIKNWLSFERGTKEPKMFCFSPNLRSVKLDLIIQKFSYHDPNMRLMTMLRPLYRHIIIHSKNRPTLVFVSDYKQALIVSESLLNYSRNEGVRFTDASAQPGQTDDSMLKHYVKAGLGYIHTGTSIDDKRALVSLFEQEKINILICTVGSCWSIRNRSYLTIIMDTMHSDGFNNYDYRLTDIIHMIGLTGRPLYDHECKAIIMCHNSKSDLYDKLLRDSLPVESNHCDNIMNIINLEIADRSIIQLNHIYKPYLAHTFFYKRISINQNFYGIITSQDPDDRKRAIASYFNDLVNKSVLELQKNDFITIEGAHQNPDFSPTLISKISLEYFVSYETLASYIEWLSEDDRQFDVRTMDLIDLLATYTYEFSSISIKLGEIGEIRRLQRRHCPSDRQQIRDYGYKVKLLILSQYGSDESIEGELKEERRLVAVLSYRLLMAIVEIAWLKDSVRLVRTALQLAKKICLFRRTSAPNLEMDVISNKHDNIHVIEITVKREDEPFDFHEFEKDYQLPSCMYRNEGWCFLVYGKPRNSEIRDDKFVLFKRVKTPSRGMNTYKLQLELGDNISVYSYDLLFMSDFYSVREDRCVTDLEL